VKGISGLTSIPEIGKNMLFCLIHLNGGLATIIGYILFKMLFWVSIRRVSVRLQPSKPQANVIQGLFIFGKTKSDILISRCF